MSSRRSVFADKLHAFPDRVFSDGSETRLRGRWAEHFSIRVPKFAGRIVLDLGCHQGQLLDQVSLAHPEVGFIGLDWSPRHLFHAAQRLFGGLLSDLGPPGRGNVALIHSRAQDLAQIFTPGELSEIWLFHPEPETPESSGRVLTRNFLLTSADLLTVGGSLHLKTDHAVYFRSACAWFGREESPGQDSNGSPASGSPGNSPGQDAEICGRFAVCHTEILLRESTGGTELFTSHRSVYEQRFRGRNRPVYYLKLLRVVGG